MTIARIGPEFVANSTTVDNQELSSVDALPDGRFVVTWTSRLTDNIFARIFNADGTESVGQFQVSTFPQAEYTSDAVVLPDGRIVIHWLVNDGGDTSGRAIYARIFNPDGTEAVAPFRVNSTQVSDQVEASIAVLPDGRFVMTFSDNSQIDGDFDLSAIRARIFNPDGSQSVPEFLVNATTSGVQSQSEVAVLADGRIVVSWTDSSASNLDIRARIFNADGTQSVPEFLVNTTTANNQFESQIAVLTDGRFVVSWSDGSLSGDDASGAAIRARIFNADGTQSVPEFLVNTSTLNSQTESNIAVLADGRFMVCWTDPSALVGDTSSFAIRARIFNADGTEAVPEFLVNATTALSQTDSQIAALADGTVVITWTDASASGADTNGNAVRTQVFDPTRYSGTAMGDTANGGAFDDRYLGYGGNDSLSGRGGDDVLNGGDGEDTLSGDEGDDTVDGGNGGDSLSGGGGNDLLYGRTGNELLFGGTGNDNLWGGAGGDQHFGGDDAGIDYARYDDANHGNLTIRLDAPNLNTGAAAGDSYSGIEGLVGGWGNDIVAGNGANNFLFGSAGADLVYGGAGNDLLFGDAGADNLWGGTGADQHYGGTDAGIDYARYDDANHGNLTISLLAGIAGTGAAAGDTYSGIEGLVGGAGNDVVVGNALANFLFGSGGNDFIDGREGNDYLNGGAGADDFRFATALGATNVDTIADFQAGVDDILLAQAIFTAIGASLTADEFRIGMAADINDFLLYNPGTGQLFYDSNANAGGGMVLFATVTVNTALTVADFVMV